MRPLTPTLLAAQQAAGCAPALSLTRRRASAFDDRYTFPAPVAPSGLPANAQTAAIAQGGRLYLYTLDPASGTVAVTAFSQNPLAQGATTALFSATGATLLAATTLPSGQVVLATGTSTSLSGLTSLWFLQMPAGPLAATDSTTLNTVEQTLFLALAAAPNGRLLAASQGQTTLLAALRAPAGGWSALAGAPERYAAPGGLAALYSVAAGPGDFLLAAVAAYDAGLSELALALFGDDTLAAAGQITPHQTVLAVATPTAYAAPGTSLRLAGATRADVFRITLLETFANQTVSPTQTWSQAYAMSVLSPQNWLAGNTREPQPLPAPQVLAPAADAGTADLWLAGAQGVTAAPAPQTQDLSSRVLRLTRRDAENGGQSSILLDDGDGALTALAASADSIGDRLALALGYVTPAGAETSTAAPLWISQVSAAWAEGSRVVEITAHDGWALLAAWRPRRTYAWLPGESTIGGIVAFICAKAGLPFAPPASPSALLGEQPAFVIRSGDDGQRALLALLALVPEVLLMTASGATLAQPLAQPAPVYSYGPGAQPLAAARATVHSQALNHVLVYGLAGPTQHVPALLAEALDVADAARIGTQPHVVRDLQLAVAQAGARAAAVLQKAQLLQDAGELAAAPNVGLELWDRLAVTDPNLGWSAQPFAVRELTTRVDRTRDGGVYTQSVGLLPWPA